MTKKYSEMTLGEIAYNIQPHRREHMQWKAIFNRYTRGKEAKLSRIKEQLRTGYPTKSEAFLKSKALGSREYQVFLAQMTHAEVKMNRAWEKYDNWTTLWETRRSEDALEREKISKGIFHHT